MDTSKNGFKNRLRSFGFAFTGILELFKSEPNARIHFIATICAFIAGFWLQISKSEWCVILIVIALVWAAEAFNMVIEKIIDHLFKDYNETARIVKDVSAGAVLICATTALISGMIIFLPKLFSLFC